MDHAIDVQAEKAFVFQANGHIYKRGVAVEPDEDVFDVLKFGNYDIEVTKVREFRNRVESLCGASRGPEYLPNLSAS